MATNKRLAWADIAKGIAFIFIVVCHVGIVFSSATVNGGMPPRLQSFAFTFHLPTFFILSGFFFHENTSLNWTFLKKSSKTLLLPYALTCLIIILGCTIAGQLRSGSGLSEFVRWAQASLWGAGDRRDVAIWQVERIGGIWFLLALFWAQLILAATNSISIPKRFALLCCLLAIGVYSNRFVWLPLSIQSGLGCAIYVYVGMLARKFGWLERSALPPWAWLAAGGIWLVVVLYGGHASIAMGDYPLGVLDVIGGIAGCMCICALSRLIDDYAKPLGRCLQLIGRNTLPLFALHIAEDNILNWGLIGIDLSTLLGGMKYTWLVLLSIRIALDFSLAALAYIVPISRTVYFSKARARSKQNA